MYYIARFFVNIYIKIFYRIEIEGLENLPQEGGYIISSNHASALDPVIIVAKIKRKIHYMAKSELFANKAAAFFLRRFGAFPVRRGAGDIIAIKTAINLLKSGKVFGIFPEGTRNKSKAIKPQPGVAMIALKADVKIVPIGITGEYKFFGKIKLKIGKPIDALKYCENSKHASTEELELISKKVMESIRCLYSGGE